MTPQVLIVASLYDFSVDLVIRRLIDLCIPYVRLNREQFSELRLTLDPCKPELRIRGLGLEVTIDSNLRSVWFRCATFPRTAMAVAATLEEQLSRSQWSAFVRALTVFSSARWMNHPAKTYQAETKAYQLATAVKCGFSVPFSLVTNDAEVAKENFAVKDVVIKSIDTAYLRDRGDMLFAYTQIIDKAVLSESNFSAIPVMAQELINPKTDIRVTVVADDIYAYQVLVDGKPAVGDWRLHKRSSISYSQVEIDDLTSANVITHGHFAL